MNGTRNEAECEKAERIWRSVLNCHVLKFEFVKEKHRKSDREKKEKKEKKPNERPSSMCIFNDGPFSFLRWFFHFWGKYYNILQMQQKRHTLQYAFDITVLPTLFVCLSLRSFLLLQLISIVFSQFIFCIFYNHVTMAMHFVCFVFYFVCVSFSVCIYIWGFFPFPTFSTVAILSLFGGQFSISFLFFSFFFLSAQSVFVVRIRLHAYFYAWPKFCFECGCPMFGCSTCTLVRPHAPAQMFDDLVFIRSDERACDATIHFNFAMLSFVLFIRLNQEIVSCWKLRNEGRDGQSEAKWQRNIEMANDDNNNKKNSALTVYILFINFEMIEITCYAISVS